MQPWWGQHIVAVPTLEPIKRIESEPWEWAQWERLHKRRIQSSTVDLQSAKEYIFTASGLRLFSVVSLVFFVAVCLFSSSSASGLTASFENTVTRCCCGTLQQRAAMQHRGRVHSSTSEQGYLIARGYKRTIPSPTHLFPNPRSLFTHTHPHTQLIRTQFAAVRCGQDKSRVPVWHTSSHAC